MRPTAMLVALVACAGCSHYYKVTEPGGGRVYYTTRVEDQPSGAVKFNDLQTNSRITLQSSDVKEIKKADLPPDLQVK